MRTLKLNYDETLRADGAVNEFSHKTIYYTTLVYPSKLLATRALIESDFRAKNWLLWMTNIVKVEQIKHGSVSFST